MEFQLYEDVKVATWRRYTYDVEAETLEEAVKMMYYYIQIRVNVQV